MKSKAMMSILTLSLMALLTVFAAPNPSAAQSKPAATKGTTPKKTEAVPKTRFERENIHVASDLTKHQQLKERLILRYRQMWNHYRFRNEINMGEDEKRAVEALIESIRSPSLSTDMPLPEIREAIKKHSVELEKRLRAEVQAKKDIDGGHAAVTARANLAYLKDVMIKGLYNNNLYNMSDKGFRDDFLRMMPETQLPDDVANPQLYPKTEVPPWLLEGLPAPTPEPTTPGTRAAPTVR